MTEAARPPTRPCRAADRRLQTYRPVPRGRPNPRRPLHSHQYGADCSDILGQEPTASQDCAMAGPSAHSRPSRLVLNADYPSLTVSRSSLAVA
jgi:hypothetical protein